MLNFFELTTFSLSFHAYMLWVKKKKKKKKKMKKYEMKMKNLV